MPAAPGGVAGRVLRASWLGTPTAAAITGAYEGNRQPDGTYVAGGGEERAFGRAALWPVGRPCTAEQARYRADHNHQRR